MLKHEEKQKILNKTAAVLKPIGVFLVGSKIYLNPGVAVGDTIGGVRQVVRNLTQIVLDTGEYPDDDVVKFRYRVRYELGTRNIQPELSEDDDNYVLLEIKAAFESHYFSCEEFSEDEINVFSELNVLYHVWPYWREYVQGSCARMGIDPIDVPFLNDMQKIKD